MKQLLTLLFLLTFQTIFGQTDTAYIIYNNNNLENKIVSNVDTVIFDSPNSRHILYNTTVLPWTYNQQVAKGYGLKLNRVSVAPCRLDNEIQSISIVEIKENNFEELKNDHDDYGRNDIVAIIEREDSLTIELKYWGNCCHSFLCDIEILTDNTINLIAYGYGSTYCSCSCCFGLTYHFNIIKSDNYNKLENIIINGDIQKIREFKKNEP